MSKPVVNSDRISALDLTKGFLVVIMVVYHTLNYSTQYQLAFRFMAFLPPSFILITGFLLSHLYIRRTSVHSSEINRRLILRGLKLLLLFTALNIGAQFTRSQNYHRPTVGWTYFFTNWSETYLSGGSRAAVFEILLPIAYLLLIAPVLLWLGRIHRFALPALCIAVIVFCDGLERRGSGSLNLSLMGAGMVGMLIGLIPPASLNRLGALLPASLLAYVVHTLFGIYFGQSFLHQVVGAIIALAIIYGIATLIGPLGWANRRLIRLGQYSLIAYISQIAILQIYTHFLGRPDPFSAGLECMFAVTLITMTLLIEGVEWGKEQSQSFRLLYRTIVP